MKTCKEYREFVAQSLSRKMKKTVFLFVMSALTMLPFTSCIKINKDKIKISSTYDNASQYKPGSEPITNAISKLEIDWISGNVVIESYDGSELTFSETSNKAITEETTMHYWLENGSTLHIQFGKSGVKFKNFDKRLTVKVPAAWNLDKIEVEAVSSDITVTGVTCGELELDGVSADMIMSKSSVRSLDMNTVSGCLSADFATADSAVVQPQKISLESVSGSTTLSWPEAWGFSVEIESVSGKFNCPFATRVSKGEYTYGNGATEIEMESVSGSLSIEH